MGSTSFNKVEMNSFFKHVYSTLENNGLLILELSVSPDSFLSYFYHDIFLRYESRFLQIILPLFGKTYKRIREVHGYRYKTREIVQIANQNGFDVVEYIACEPLIEFQRSLILRRLIDKNRLAKKVLTKIGSYVPYSRLFTLKRLDF